MRLLFVSSLALITPTVLCASISVDAPTEPLGILPAVKLDHDATTTELFNELEQLQDNAVVFLKTMEKEMNVHLEEEAVREGWNADMPRELVPLLKALPSDLKATYSFEDILQSMGNNLVQYLNDTSKIGLQSSKPTDMGMLARNLFSQLANPDPFKGVEDPVPNSRGDILTHAFLKILQEIFNTESTEFNTSYRKLLQSILKIVNSVGQKNFESPAQLFSFGESLTNMLMHEDHQLLRTVFSKPAKQIQQLIELVYSKEPDVLHILSHPTEESVGRLSNAVNSALKELPLGQQARRS